MNASLPRLGQWTSILGILLVLGYIGAIMGTAVSGAGFPPGEPYASIIAIVTLISAPLIVFLWIIIHELTPARLHVWTRASLSLIIIFATLTCINRYVQITVVRSSLSSGNTDGVLLFLPYGNPSVMASLEQFAWGFFFGLALLTLAPAFSENKVMLWTLLVSGILSLGAIVGQTLSITALTFVALLAWGPGFLLLLVLFIGWYKKFN